MSAFYLWPRNFGRTNARLIPRDPIGPYVSAHMPASSAASMPEMNPSGLDDSLAADLRKLVSSSELHRLCASALTDRQAPVESASDQGVVSWGIGTETQQVRSHRSQTSGSESSHALAAFRYAPAAGATTL